MRRRPLPTRARTLHFGGDQLSEHGAAETDRERRCSQALADRAQHHGAARDRRQQHVTDVGHFDRNRAAVGAAANAQRERGHDEEPDDRRAAFEEVGAVDPVADHAVDGFGHPHHEGQPDQCEQVDPVGNVVPVGLAESATLAGLAELKNGYYLGDGELPDPHAQRQNPEGPSGCRCLASDGKLSLPGGGCHVPVHPHTHRHLDGREQAPLGGVPEDRRRSRDQAAECFDPTLAEFPDGRILCVMPRQQWRHA